MIKKKMSLRSGCVLEFGAGRPLVMGIVNATPDSFYPGGRTPDPEAALTRAMALLDEGADILDIGGESSRPGSAYVDEETELSRVVPLVKAIRALSPVPLSVDTRKAAVAAAAAAEGADIVNDISALADDPAMARLCAREGLAVVLMHKRGTPATMQAAPSYADPAGEVLAELRAAVDAALAAGVPADAIMVDPGIGFGKRLPDNLELLRSLARFSMGVYPVVAGLSMKSFLGELTGKPVGARLAATVASSCAAALLGADVLRVHDAAAARDALAVMAALGPWGGTALGMA